MHTKKRTIKKDSFESNFILISSIIVLCCLILFSAYFIFFVIGNEKQEDPSQISKIENCLKQNAMSVECNLILSSSNLKETCEKISDKNLQDKCFNNLANQDNDKLICEKISNTKLKENCIFRNTVENFPREDQSREENDD
jgi:hypothetical protein